MKPGRCAASIKIGTLRNDPERIEKAVMEHEMLMQALMIAGTVLPAGLILAVSIFKWLENL